MVYAVTLAGLGINLVYFGTLWAGVGARFRDNLAGNLTIIALLLITPSLTYFIDHALTSFRVRDLSRIRQPDVLTRSHEHKYLKELDRDTMGAAGNLTFVIGSDGRFNYVDGNSLQVLGFAPEDLIGRQFSDLVATGSLATAVSNFEKIMWGDEVEPYVLQIEDRKGSIKCVSISSIAYREGGNVIAQVGVASP
ncbi:MAG TPA: PAS domain-containing protein, partial [Terriglobales bacterium]|nr:PAS domain-containing protein [Terriglobales bacterium]